MRDSVHPEYPQLSDFADGDLNIDAVGSIRTHLELCMNCQEEVRFIWALGEAIRALPIPAAPPGLIDCIFAT